MLYNIKGMRSGTIWRVQPKIYHTPVGLTLLRQNLSYMTYQGLRQYSSGPPQRTFQLCDFHSLFGSDAHYYIFFQRESNSLALANLERNLQRETAGRRAQFIPRIYTEADITNIQASCLDILDGFSGTSDVVSYLVITGKIHVEPCAPDITANQATEWFENTYSCTKYPDWRRLGGKVFDLEAERYEPHQDSDNVGKWKLHG